MEQICRFISKGLSLLCDTENNAAVTEVQFRSVGVCRSPNSNKVFIGSAYTWIYGTVTVHRSYRAQVQMYYTNCTIVIPPNSYYSVHVIPANDAL